MRWLLAIGLMLVLAGCGSSSSTTRQLRGAGGYVDHAGRFSARFPAAPKQSDEPASFGDVHLKIHAAVARGPHDQAFVIESTDLTPAVPAAAEQPNLLAAIKGVTSTSKLVLQGQPTSVRFRGDPGERGYYTIGHSRYEGVAFFAGRSRFLVIVAPATKFSSFSSSLAFD